MQDATLDDDVAVLISSCDSYNDIWGPFFALFFKYWPDCPYPVYLSTNHLDYNHPRVTTIKIGDDTNWSAGFRCVLEQIQHPYLIVMMEDFLPIETVNATMIERLVCYMDKKKAGYLRLFPCPGPDLPCNDNPEVGEISKGSAYRLSLQAAIWNKQVLIDLLREGESAWELEINGTKRTNNLNVPFLCVTGKSPIPYFCTGVVKGKWMREAVELCKREGIEIDVKVRPIQTSIDRLLRSTIVSKIAGITKYRLNVMKNKRNGD